jgi:hypothetical protein
MVLPQIAMMMIGMPWTLRPVDTAERPDLLATAATKPPCAAQPITSIDGIESTAVTQLTGVLAAAWASVPGTSYECARMHYSSREIRSVPFRWA